jgi:hypothetical protein
MDISSLERTRVGDQRIERKECRREGREESYLCVLGSRFAPPRKPGLALVVQRPRIGANSIPILVAPVDRPSNPRRSCAAELSKWQQALR